MYYFLKAMKDWADNELRNPNLAPDYRSALQSLSDSLLSSMRFH